MQTIVINLFGGPGTGKSTLCATLFAHLKMKGIDAEMAPEYVKNLVWEESYKKIENQVYIFGKQHHTINRLKNKVNVIITDSPLLNSIVYYNGKNPYFTDMIMWEYKNMNNISFYLDRNFKYVENGRTQKLEEAMEIDLKYKNLLDYNDVDYNVVKSPYNIDEMVNLIIDKLNG